MDESELESEQNEDYSSSNEEKSDSDKEVSDFVKNRDKQAKKKEQKQSTKISRLQNDLWSKDINKRTIIHRAALEQNYELLETSLEDLKSMIHTTIIIQKKANKELLDSKDIEIRLKEEIKVKVNEKDKFGNTSMISACALKPTGQHQRYKILSLLMNYGADISVVNPRTQWSALHWCSHWGEYDCVKLLLEPQYQPGIKLEIPDYLGQ